MEKPIFVTQPSMPPLQEFTDYLEKIWANKYLTNNGMFHQELEKSLCDYLGVKYLSLFSNCTLALITALQALRITGSVITTPFSFVATTHALHWNGIKPIFVDIEPQTFNIDPEKIEAAITPQTTAILPVHVYGNPSNVERIQQIADTYGLKVIYDAAHAFGVTIQGNSVLNFGDMSVLSFHATKVFTTFEGGAIISKDAATKKRIDYLKNFGFADELTVVAPGINAKMNEVQAAFGLLQLKYVDQNIGRRAAVAQRYRVNLKGISGIRFLEDIPGVRPVHSYFPILVEPNLYGKTRDDIYDTLKSSNIFSRRYFFPLISHFSTYKSLDSAQPSNLPVAESIAKQVLCLPIFPDLTFEELDEVVAVIANLANH